MSRKVTYIISNIDRWVAFEWIIENIDKNQFDLRFILINSKNSYFEYYLIENNIDYYQFDYNSKFQLPTLIFRITRALRKFKTDVVHTHFLEANIIGLTAAKLAGIQDRIHTRHHSIFHHHYAAQGVFLDKLCNKLSTKIISISKVVTNVLFEKEKVDQDKIVLIHHGFNLEKFIYPNDTRIKELKVKYTLGLRYPVIGVVSRFIEWKGIQYAIDAFKQILVKYPDAVLFLANARGPQILVLDNLTEAIPTENIRKIPFEKDLFSLYHLFDVFVHVPISKDVEAFGQIYVEALAAGVPSIFTKSGIANDFIQHERNAIVVPYRNSEAIYEGILKIIDDKDLVKKMVLTGQKDVNELFRLEKMMDKLNQLYSE